MTTGRYRSCLRLRGPTLTENPIDHFFEFWRSSVLSGQFPHDSFDEQRSSCQLGEAIKEFSFLSRTHPHYTSLIEVHMPRTS